MTLFVNVQGFPWIQVGSQDYHHLESETEMLPLKSVDNPLLAVSVCLVHAAE